jgi:hypothetical protein
MGRPTKTRRETMTETKTITLPQKMSGTGNIYDLESDQYDITINMGERYVYAVGGPDYYGIRWTRHATEDAALKRYSQLKRQGYSGIVILDADGYEADHVMRRYYPW